MKRTIQETGDCLTVLQQSGDPINPVRLECDETFDASDLSVDSGELVESFVTEWKARKSGRFEDVLQYPYSDFNEIEVNEALLVSAFNNPIDTEDLIHQICATPAPVPLVKQTKAKTEPQPAMVDSTRRLIGSGTVTKGATLLVRDKKAKKEGQHPIEQKKGEVKPPLEQQKVEDSDSDSESEYPSTRLFVFGDADFLELGVLESCRNVFQRILLDYGDRVTLDSSPTVKDNGVPATQITIPADLLEDLKFVNNTMLAQITCYLSFARYFRDIYCRSDPLPACTMFEPVTPAEQELRARLDLFRVGENLTACDQSALTNMELKLYDTISEQNELYLQKHGSQSSAFLRRELQTKAAEFAFSRYRPKVKTCNQFLEALKLYEADCFFNPKVNTKYAGQADEIQKLRAALLSNLEETRRHYMTRKANEFRAQAETCLSTKQVLQYVFEHAKKMPTTYHELLAAVVTLYGITLGVYSSKLTSKFRSCRTQKRQIQLVYSSYCHPQVVEHIKENERLKALRRAGGVSSEWDSDNEAEVNDHCTSTALKKQT